MVMEKKVELTDEVVLPLMNRYKIPREEAEKRLHLLYEAGILNGRSPDDTMTQRHIDNFLSHDSDTLKDLVAFEKIFTKCLSNAALVRQYDRLTFNNLAKSLRKANAGLPPANFERQLAGFEKFVRETIIARMVND